MVHEHIENAVDHAEVVVAVGVLLLDVDEVLREAVEPAAVTRKTASAAPGLSRRKSSGSAIAYTSTSELARTVAVATLSSTTDISPNTAPGVSTRANGTPSRSTFTDPETSTNMPSWRMPSSIRTSPAGTERRGRPSQ